MKHLAIQRRKSQQISAQEAVFECCFEAKSAVMVSKYLKCRIIDCSHSEQPRFARALKTLGRTLEKKEELSDISHFLEKKTIHHENVKEIARQICLLLEDATESNNEEVLALKQAISFLENEYDKECVAFEVFLHEFQTNKVVYSSFVNSVEKLKATLESVDSKPTIASKSTQFLLSEPSSFAKLFEKFNKLKKVMSLAFCDLFHEELQKMEKVQVMENTWQKVQSLVEMISKVCTLIGRAKEMEVTKILRLQRNKFHQKNGAFFSEVPLHSFEDRCEDNREDATHPSKSVIVDLMNNFDGPVHFLPFSERFRSFWKNGTPYFGADIKERLFLFLQISHGVRELKNLGIVHRNIQLKNTVIHSNSKWVRLSDFGMAIKCPTEEMILSAEEHKGVCGTAIAPPELKDSDMGTIKMDKFDVHSLGWVLQELIASYRITNENEEEVKTKVIEFLTEVQKRMVCEYRERMNIEEVIGVVEWILYHSDSFGLYRFKATKLPTTQMWDCHTAQELQEMQKKIIMAGIGQEGTFGMEEWMEIMFILTFTLEKKQQIIRCVNQLKHDGSSNLSREVEIAAGPEETRQESYSVKEFNYFIFLIKNLNMNVPLEKLAVKGVLGTGCNGIVWLVEANLRGKPVELALKMLYNYTRVAIQFSALKNIDREFDTLCSFPVMHKNVVQILSKFIAEPTREMMALLTQLHPDMIQYMMEENTITKQNRPAATQFFLIEYHPLTLQKKVDNLGRKFTWREIHKYTRDLLSASLFLFNNHVVHRDVKLENILVSGDDHLVLADFGESMHTDSNHCVPKEKLTAATPLYVAPEVANTVSNIIDFSGQYSWETGCVIYELIEGKFPFPFHTLPVKEGAEPFGVTHPSEAKEELLDLVKKMIQVNVKERISIQQAWNEFKQISI